jgi:hypothetical protein
MKNSSSEPRPEANQTVRLEIDTKDGNSSIRISFTDQRLTAHGGMVVWAHHLKQRGLRQQLREVLPHCPSSPNSYDPTDVALGCMGGIVCGADKLSRVAWLQSDPAIAEVLGIEAVASQSTSSRFFAVFGQSDCNRLNDLHRKAIHALPTRAEGYTLDLDSWALLHEDGHQEGVRIGYTRQGLKPCHRPLVAGLAEPKMIAGYWLRRGDSHCVNGAAEFLRQTVTHLPKHVRIGLVRGDSGFGDNSVVQGAEKLGLRYLFVARLTQNIQSLCRHDNAAWQKTEIDGLEVQEVPWSRVGQRLIVVRQQIDQRPEAGGKQLLEVPGYRFQAFITNLASTVSALEVWRRYHGRADLENRIKELGDQFGIQRLCVSSFWGTEALHHLAILAYNLCVLLQRKLGQLELCQLNTLRWRLFSRAAVWSQAQGKPFREILNKLLAFPNCNAVGSLQA